MLPAFENQPQHRISGAISLSAGTSNSKTSMALTLPSDITFKASVPLNFEDGFSHKIAFGTTIEKDSFKAQVGKIALESGSSFFVSTSSSQSFRIHPIAAKLSDTVASPWGLALSSSIFSGFVSKSERTLSVAAQVLFPKDLPHFALGLGSILEIEDQSALSERIRPWLGMSALFGGRNAQFLWKTQLFPALFLKENNFYENSWLYGLYGAACGIDLSLGVKKIVIENSFYGELRDFIDARGKISKYDMRDQLRMTVNISEKALLRNIHAQLSIVSLQGPTLDDAHAAPSNGTFPNFYLLKYWPDNAEIATSLQSNAVRASFFRFALRAEGAIKGSCTFKSQGNSAKLGFEVQLRNAEHETHFLRGTTELQSSSNPDNGVLVDEDELVSEISETEMKEEAARMYFNYLAISLCTNIEWFSLSSTFNVPLKLAEGAKISAKLYASAKFSSCFIEASVSMTYAHPKKSLSLSSFRMGARYSF